MTDLRIRITDSDGIRYYGYGENRHALHLYTGPDIEHALSAILEGMEQFRDTEAMVKALSFCPEFCQLAAAVHGLHLAESDETPATEAIAILTKLRDSRQPEAIRTRAGNLLIDIAEGDRAMCDASTVDDRPGQDAGAALVGVECYLQRADGYNWVGPARVDVFDPDDSDPVMPYVSFDARVIQARFTHARPAYLGLPEASA